MCQIRSCTLDFGVEMLCLSFVIGYFIGGGEQKNEYLHCMIKFVIDICKIILSVDYRIQSFLLCFLCIAQFYSEFLDKGMTMVFFTGKIGGAAACG